MKKILILSIVFVLCSVLAPLGARIITANPNKLPLPVQNFLATQFPNLRITIIKIDADPKYHYEVLLSDGSSIVFPKRGNWTRIHGGMGNVPASLLPDNIQKYLDEPNDRLGHTGQIEIRHRTTRWFASIVQQERRTRSQRVAARLPPINTAL